MDYRRFDDTVVLRLDPGEEICEKLLLLAEREEIRLAEISGLGAVNEISLGVYDTVNRKYLGNAFRGIFEITSLTGTVTRQDGKPYLHVHMSAGDAHGAVIGGHLVSAKVSATAEIVVRVIEGYVDRRFSDSIGLNLMKF